MEKKKLLSLLSSVAGNTASYIYLLDGQPQWRTTSSSVYISIACSSCRLGLSVDQIGPHWTLIGCLCLQIGHSRDCRHCLRHISTRHLEWKAWLQYICPEPERWHKGFRSSILFDPIRSCLADVIWEKGGWKLDSQISQWRQETSFDSDSFPIRFLVKTLVGVVAAILRVPTYIPYHTMIMMHRASSRLSSFDWVQAYGADGIFIPQKYLLPKSQANWSNWFWSAQRP